MKYAEYKSLVKVISKCRSRREVLKLAESHGFKHIPSETLISIFSVGMQMIRTEAFHRLNNDKVKGKFYKEFFERVRNGEEQVVLKMAEELELSPCMLIRFILDQHVLKEHPTEFKTYKERASAVTDILKKTRALHNPVLASAIQEAVFKDDIFGPYADKVRRAIGLEFEEKLKNWCIEQGIGFLTEEKLRDIGCDKTPDVKLTLPIAVDGFVVNWIESKAMFGDCKLHTKHIKDQIGPYTRRYGPGLVIYWFGFIDELDCQRANNIAVSDHLPKTVQKIDIKLWEEHKDWDIPKPDLWQPEVKWV